MGYQPIQNCENCAHYYSEQGAMYGFCHREDNYVWEVAQWDCCPKYRFGLHIRPAVSESQVKTNGVKGNIKDANAVIIYGDVKGNIIDCENVIIINGDIKGNIKDCNNVCGLLADQSI